MFDDTDLITHVDTSQALEVEAGCFLELNQNDFTNIHRLGVFKYGEYPSLVFTRWIDDEKYYYKHDPVTSDMVKTITEKDNMYIGTRPKSDFFSLADCLTEFRPRSGILKIVQPFTKSQVFIDDFTSVRRPRFYVPTVKDQFKYWTSWNTDVAPALNIGLSDSKGIIKNAAPFVVYTEPIAANQVTVKIQTGNGESRATRISVDPLIDKTKSTLPRRWRIEYLDVTGTWQTIKSYGEYDSLEVDPISGNIDLVYMIENPDPVRFPNFVLKGYMDSPAHLPYRGRFGEAFVIGRSRTKIGKVVIWNGSEWEGAEEITTGNDDGVPDMKFTWRQHDYSINPEEYAVRSFVDPLFYNPNDDIDNQFTDFVLMKGLRVVVEELLSGYRPFELIEMSPRLFCNLSHYVESYNITKSISDDSVLPVGDMTVSNGTITLSNMDLILNREKKFDWLTATGSILSQRIRKNSKFILYEIIKKVGDYDKFVPVKTLYATDKPAVISGTEAVDIELRDLTFYFEEHLCPNIILKDCALTKAVAVLLDGIGFSNYIFYVGDSRNKNYTSPYDTIIPYFFTNETMSVAETLKELSIATQCAMFFDENNNFVVMPREHFGTDPVYSFRSVMVDDKRPNIEDINDFSLSTTADVTVKFTHRDIAREYLMDLQNRIRNDNAQTTLGEESNTVGYKVSSLWDASKLDNPTLAVGVLRTSLPALAPKYNPQAPDGVSNGAVDIGLWAEFYGNFEGLIMMNGEIIRYDAKQYSINGRNYWVTSQNHLNELIGRSPFYRSMGAGQMVYPTGLLRIYTEWATDNNGNLVMTGHGRGMYNTPIVYHPAEPLEWTRGVTHTYKDTALDTVFGVVGISNYSFAKHAIPRYPTRKARVTNYIYNPMHSKNSPVALNPIDIKANDVNSFDVARRIMRASALTFAGPVGATASDVSMKLKQLPGNGYRLFGMRMGIVGNLGAAETEQSPFGSTVLGTYRLGSDSSDAEDRTIIGAGGGLVFGTSRLIPGSSNEGYCLEITALNSSYTAPSEDDDASDAVVFSNINFYKIQTGTTNVTDLPPGNTPGNVAYPLWSTFQDIRVTSGSQMARDRLMTDVNVVYDVAVEMKHVRKIKGIIRVFYIYINDILVGTVEDTAGYRGANLPPINSNMEIGVFVRGESTIQVEHLYAAGTDEFNTGPVYVDGRVYDRPRSYKQFSPSALWSTVALNGGPQNQYRYWEEFGSTAREARYLDMNFELFPSLTSKIARTAVFDRAFSTTHFTADPYSGNMLIVAQSDRSIRLAEDANLVVHGLTLADNEEQTISIDDLLTGNVDGANILKDYNSGIQLRNRLLALRVGRATEKVDFESMYIQSRDHALKMLKWMSGFVGTETAKMTITAFGIPHIQIGDVVSIEHQIPDRVDLVETKEFEPDNELYGIKMVEFASNDSRFMVKRIDIERTLDGPVYTVDLIELPSTTIWNAGDF